MPSQLHYGQCYHIYNRGTNGESLFREERNYVYFLRLYARYVEPIAQTFAYCLLNNHFHFLIRIKTAEEQQTVRARRRTALVPSRQFNNFFIAYAKAINTGYQRTGALFESPFKRSLVSDERYFTALVAYIHRNPQTHGFVNDFRDWPYTSYGAILSTKPSRIQRETVLEWFDGPTEFENLHATTVTEVDIRPLVEGDWV